MITIMIREFDVVRVMEFYRCGDVCFPCTYIYVRLRFHKNMCAMNNTSVIKLIQITTMILIVTLIITRETHKCGGVHFLAT